ncbi:MAG TPA: peptide deformylase [Chitinophagaceae bacterium]|nr:peptide deformylase [Chitinophagaceae bacterium]HNF71405.1 peptide deformylase [Chitinophagaceae bacterium]
MNLPIVAYGHNTLRKVGVEIDENYPGLKELIANMWDTLYHSNGVGLAAPQVNHSIRLFLVDSIQIVEGADEEDKEEYKNEKPVKQVFINPYILEEEGTEWKYNEGCLSIPKIREDILRKPRVKIRYQDENFQEHTGEFDGITARIIQHEYDHIEGKLFIDHLSPLKRRLLKNKLEDITKGRVKVNYKMLFPK